MQAIPNDYPNIKIFDFSSHLPLGFHLSNIKEYLKVSINTICDFIENNQVFNSFTTINKEIYNLLGRVKKTARNNLFDKKITIFKNLNDNSTCSIIGKKDLVYGLAMSRKIFLDIHLKNNEKTFNRLDGTRVKPGKKRAVIVDTLNNQFLGTGYSYNSQDLKNKRKISNKQFEMSHTYQEKKTNGIKDVQQFRQFLEEHKKYDPRKIPSRQDIDLRIGRACKAGLEFTIKNNRKIHFVLDGLDINYVFTDLAKDIQLAIEI
jgi:hypothetical protein